MPEYAESRSFDLPPADDESIIKYQTLRCMSLNQWFIPETENRPHIGGRSVSGKNKSLNMDGMIRPGSFPMIQSVNLFSIDIKCVLVYVKNFIADDPLDTSSIVNDGSAEQGVIF